MGSRDARAMHLRRTHSGPVVKTWCGAGGHVTDDRSQVTCASCLRFSGKAPRQPQYTARRMKMLASVKELLKENSDVDQTDSMVGSVAALSRNADGD